MEEDEKDQVCPRSGGERAENRREAQRSEGQRCQHAVGMQPGRALATKGHVKRQGWAGD